MYFVHYCLWDYWVEISWSKWLITNIKQIEEVYPSPHVVPSPFVVAPLPSLSLGLTTCLSILKIVFVTSKNFFSDLSQKGLEFECCSGHSPSRFCFSHIVHGQNVSRFFLFRQVCLVLLLTSTVSMHLTFFVGIRRSEFPSLAFIINVSVRRSILVLHTEINNIFIFVKNTEI